MRVSGTLKNTFRTCKLQDRAQLVVAKKEVKCDHLAVDVSGTVGMALRLAKNCPTEAKRNSEVARLVSQNLNNITKRFHPKQSLALFMHGPEPLWRAHRHRTAPINRRLELRLQRLPGNAIMHAVEDKLIKALPSPRLNVPEIVFSGTAVPGLVEQKLAQWALDVADRPSVDAGAAEMLVVGSGDIYTSALGLTPYYNVTALTQNNADFKQLTLQDALQWFELDELVENIMGSEATEDSKGGGNHALMARVRTDTVLLVGLTSGFGATDLPGLVGVTIQNLMPRYVQVCREAIAAATAASEQGSSAVSKAELLTVEQPNGTIAVNVPFLLKMLQGVSSMNAPPSATSSSGAAPMPQSAAAPVFWELMLQSLSMVATGVLPAPLYGHDLSIGAALPAVTVEAFLVHLKTVKGPLAEPERSPSLAKPLCAAEYSLLSHTNPTSVGSLVTTAIGATTKPGAAELITTAKTIGASHEHAQKMLEYANPASPHRSLHLSPSYCWMQSGRMKTWQFHYVDLGKRSSSALTRLRRNRDSGASIQFTAAAEAPVVFDSAAANWVPLRSFDTLNAPNKPLSKFKMLTWNVMFDRYSGQPTPLGMPGIDWCSPKRYPVIAQELEESDADIVAMQEVEAPFWKHLSENKWIRENYFFSCGEAGASISPWGVLLLVKRTLKVRSITHVNVPAFSGHMSLMPIVTFEPVPGKPPVAIGSAHLLAPFTKGHISVRTAQDDVLRQRMLSRSFPTDALVAGDFNDWPTNEFTMPTESHYEDVWTKLNPTDLGKTMDESNEFCKLKIEEMFFGRSDKIFLRGKRLLPEAAKLVGTRSVNEVNGNNKAPGYLFPSDHYGVEATFRVALQ